MERIIVLAIVAILAAPPVMAGGYYRKAPCKTCNKKCTPMKNIGKALLFTVKLPVRLVTSTVWGTYKLAADQNLEGFEDGFYVI